MSDNRKFHFKYIVHGTILADTSIEAKRKSKMQAQNFLDTLNKGALKNGEIEIVFAIEGDIKINNLGVLDYTDVRFTRYSYTFEIIQTIKNFEDD